MTVGIAAYDCRFPVWRLSVEALAEAWGRAPAGLRGKRVAGLDEDALTLALAARYVLRHRPGPVVTNLSTSRVVRDVAEAAGCQLHLAPVGEANVAARMREVGA
ncbi:MAG: hypothetical protein ACOC5E_00315, partial [Acidobacteriota bacterium]